MKTLLTSISIFFLTFFGLFGTAQAAVDLTAVTTAFADLNTALTTVGGLLLSAAVLAVTFKWIKGSIFG